MDQSTSPERPVTPIEEYLSLAKTLGLNAPLYFKREDLHLLGSHKGRSIPVMIDRYAAGGGFRKFVITGSGNAALAAVRHVIKYNNEYSEQTLSLKIFVGENINQDKLTSLKEEIGHDESFEIEHVERPKMVAHRLEKFSDDIKYLRQSKDALALEGYRALAEEIVELKPAAVFVPTSSGTTAEALGRLLPNSQIHAVQTTKCNAIACEFDKDFEPTNSSLADAIIDVVGERKVVLVPLIRRSGGSAWVVSDKEITAAKEIVRSSAGLEISPNSALAVAGLQKSLTRNWTFATDQPVVCLITGN